MGGDYYDRDVGTTTTTTTTNVGYSAEASKVVGKVHRLSLAMDPKRFKTVNMVSTYGNPIVFSLDVTGSMGDWTRIIYDKMPMFYGQIMIQKYLTDPAISFCAVGDHLSDEAPLQVSDFAKGKEIDDNIGEMFLEGGGGGTFYESYDLAAYFYLNFVDLKNSVLPFFFVTGDEAFYEKIQEKHIFKFLGKNINGNFVIARDTWKDLMKKYNVFLIKKTYEEESIEVKIKKQWNETIGEERVLYISTPKACVDVMLGAIALTSGTRTIDSYIQDMKDRGQTPERIKEVTASLSKYWEKLSALRTQTQSTTKINSDNANTSSENLSQHVGAINLNEKEIMESVEKQMENELDSESIKLRDDLKHLKKIFGTVPEELICPITGEIFIDPVMTCDGHTYEKVAIEAWLIKKKTSPVTNLALENKNLIPNFVIKQLVKAFYEDNIDKLK
jgi:hypothetical protein